MNTSASIEEIARLERRLRDSHGSFVSIGTAESATAGRIADRITEGDVSLERATDLLVGITWRGLRGVGSDSGPEA